MTGLEPDDAQLGKRTEALFRDFENETDALLEPLAPQQIRRLGERRRTRRRATIGAGALALTTVAAGSVMGLGGLLGGSNEIDTASRPSSSQTPPAQNPSAENSLATAPLPSANSSASASSSPSSVSSPTGSQVPTASPGAVTAAGWADVPGTSLVYRNRPGDLPVVAEVADDSSPQQALSICEQDRTSLGQSKDLSRVFQSDGKRATAMVWSFDSVEEASQARAEVRSWYYNCATATRTNATDITVEPAMDSPIGSQAATSDTVQATFRVVRYAEAGVPHLEEASIFQVGNRLELLVYTLSNATDSQLESSSETYPGMARAAEVTNLLAP